MSSQGSSRVRTISEAVFVPMLGDPLSREVSMPSASSNDSTPEVVSRPVDKGAMEPARETVSTSGRQSEEEKDDVAVSCRDL